MKLGISEILTKANDMDDPEKRIEFIRQNDSIPLRNLLRHCFDEKISFSLPKGKAPYKPSEFPDSQGMLFQEIRRFYIFVTLDHQNYEWYKNNFGNYPNSNINQVKREQLFIGMLESLDSEDAKLLVSIKDKKMPYKRLTRKFFEKVYPGLFDE